MIRLTRKELQGAAIPAAAVEAVLVDGVWKVDWTEAKQLDLLKRSPIGRYLGEIYLAGLAPLWRMRHADLRGVDLAGGVLCFLDFGWGRLRGAKFAGTDLLKASFFHTDLESADLRGADLRRADFSNAYLHRADLTGALRYVDDPPLPGWTAAAPPNANRTICLKRESDFAAPTVQTAEYRRRHTFASVRNEDFDRPLFAAQ